MNTVFVISSGRMLIVSAPQVPGADAREVLVSGVGKFTSEIVVWLAKSQQPKSPYVARKRNI